MTQKEALANMLDTLSYDFRILLITNWLEDINWHAENRMFQERVQYKNENAMQWFENNKTLINPGTYCSKYAIEKNKAATASQVQEVDELLSKGLTSTSYGIINSTMVHDFKKAETYYNAFNTIFGWGISSDGWNTRGIGKEFVDELIEMLENFQ